MNSLRNTDPATQAFAETIGPTGPVSVAGNKTRWQVGGTLKPTTRVVSAPTGILHYQPDEMTVHVRAGTNVAELHDNLQKAGQRTALPDRGGTVGGALAVGENHLHVLGVGPVRNALLQVRYVSNDGSIVTGGGPTVKNVTGFDLPKVMVGSLGTLGLLADVILRTNPIPDSSVWLQSDDTDPFSLYDQLYKPSAILWNGLSTWVLLEGHDSDITTMRAAMSKLGTHYEVEGPPELPCHRWRLTPKELRHLDDSTHGGFVASIGVGTVFSDQPPPVRQVEPGVQKLSRDLKRLFDPENRLNPGRNLDF